MANKNVKARRYTSPGKHAKRDFREVQAELLACVRGEKECDWVIRNANIADVLSHEFCDGDVYIASGYIVHVDYGLRNTVPMKPLSAKNSINAEMSLLTPGFVDTHIHIESTMLTPWQLGRELALQGTTCIFADPHEIVNVAGKEAFEYMIRSSADSPIRQYFLVPSSVPSAPDLENAGADWDAETIGEMLDLAADPENRVVGLAEAMAYVDIITGEPRAAAIMQAANSRLAFVQAHTFGTYGQDLSAYLLAGPNPNHEALSGQDLRNFISMGMRVDLRTHDSLVDYNARGLVCAALRYDPDGNMTSLCTDDIHITDILSNGHIRNSVRTMMDGGDTTLTAIKRATLSAYQEYGIPRAGAIAPGYIADFQLFNSHSLMYNPHTVFVDGEPIVCDGKLVGNKVQPKPDAFEKKNTVNLAKSLSLKDFQIKAPKGAESVSARAIAIDGINARFEKIKLTVDLFGDLCLEDVSRELFFVKVKVFNRYGLSTSGTGFLLDYTLGGRAIASTISHDSHNLTVVYNDPEAALRICRKLVKCGGGLAYASADDEDYVLPLPVGGLMSAEPAQEVSDKLEELEVAYRRDGGGNIMNIAILALPVVPEARISDCGLVDVVNHEIVPLFID